MKRYALVLFVAFTSIAQAENAKDALIRCSRESNEQGLKGDARKAYMLDCMHKATPTTMPTGNAPSKPTGNPINGLMYYGSMATLTKLEGQAQAQLGKTDDFMQKSADLRATSAALDDEVPLAVKAAKGKADLVKAIKEYYTAASAYVGGGIPTDRIEKIQDDRLKSDMDAKEKALELEMKLAGMK